jgi:hypothetical protein
VRVVPYLEGKVTTLTWEADLIVFDIPSTALLEALATTAPIVVFADRRSLLMRSEAKDKLRRRCTLSETPDEFIADLRRMLAAGRFERVNEPDTAFDRAYASADGDGGSAERAATAIISIVSSGRPPRHPHGDETPSDSYGVTLAPQLHVIGNEGYLRATVGVARKQEG